MYCGRVVGIALTTDTAYKSTGVGRALNEAVCSNCLPGVCAHLCMCLRQNFVFYQTDSTCVHGLFACSVLLYTEWWHQP